jgi:hypothetical protein
MATILSLMDLPSFFFLQIELIVYFFNLDIGVSLCWGEVSMHVWFVIIYLNSVDLRAIMALRTKLDYEINIGNWS